MPDWRNFCRGSNGISVDGDFAEVVTRDSRRHRVAVRETAETIELTGVVARPSAIRDIRDLPLRVWRHNRAVHLVGFRLDQRGRLIAEAWVPKAGLTRADFLFYVKHVATECDLFEYSLTGEDRE